MYATTLVYAIIFVKKKHDSKFSLLLVYLSDLLGAHYDIDRHTYIQILVKVYI